ncbi:hypothetical protein PQX77_010435 [Marasmius sp. AFHP31]|nr:hypothetical protein PQX77_010435 [Marasmius sp. AFHP31]
MTRLPPTLTSVYRLFLRTASASVLHHRIATRNLRQLWRPVFEDAAQVVKKMGKAKDGQERRDLENWLGQWEKRMDNTLSILYNSAKTRGLSHQLTRNLSFLVLGEHQRLRNQERNLPLWNPQLPPDAREYQVKNSKVTGKDEKRQRRKEFEETAWRALGEVVRMAEGRNELSLGRIIAKGKIRPRGS